MSNDTKMVSVWLGSILSDVDEYFNHNNATLARFDASHYLNNVPERDMVPH